MKHKSYSSRFKKDAFLVNWQRFKMKLYNQEFRYLKLHRKASHQCLEKLLRFKLEKYVMINLQEYPVWLIKNRRSYSEFFILASPFGTGNFSTMFLAGVFDFFFLKWFRMPLVTFLSIKYLSYLLFTFSFFIPVSLSSSFFPQHQVHLLLYHRVLHHLLLHSPLH